MGLTGSRLASNECKNKILRLSDDAINECNIILEKLFADLENRQKINFDTLQKIKEISRYEMDGARTYNKFKIR